MKVLLTIKYEDKYLKKIEQLGYDVVVNNKELTQDDYMCDVLHGFKTLTKENIHKFKNLKFVQLASIGFEHLPKEELLNTDIVISNQKGVYSKPIGEWIVFNILQILKNDVQLVKNRKLKKWEFIKDIDEIEGKKIVFLGTGTISVEGAKRLSNFGAKIIGLNSNGRSIEWFDECYKLSDIDKYTKNADFIVNVLPSTKDTINFVNKDVISKFKKGVNFINVSRGDVVNEEDLIQALKDGTIGKAALDVFEKEPLDENSPLWEMENVYISPHISWSSSKKQERVFENLYENLKRFIEYKELENVVDLKKGY